LKDEKLEIWSDKEGRWSIVLNSANKGKLSDQWWGDFKNILRIVK